MAQKRKYICGAPGCDKEFGTSEGLNFHLDQSGHPRDQVRVVAEGTGQLVALKRGRPSASGGGSSGGASGSPRAAAGPKVRQVAIEGTPPPIAAPAPDKEPKGKPAASPLPTVSPFLVSFFNMIPMQATIYNTPALWTSFACARLRGFKGDYNEFLTVAALDFWLGREINPFEELTVVFQGVPSSLLDKLQLMGGAHEPGHTGLDKDSAEAESVEPE